MLDNLSGQPSLVHIRFFADMRRYGQIIFALLQRELENRRKHPFESFLDILEPVVLSSLMGVLWSVLNRRTSSPLGDSPMLFVATGFYAKFFWISVARMSKSNIGISNRRFPVERRFDYILVHL